MATLREHIKNNTSVCGLRWQVAHQVNLVQFLKAGKGLESKCNANFKKNI